MRWRGSEKGRIGAQEKLMCNVVGTQASKNPIRDITLGKTVPEAEGNSLNEE